MSLNAGPLPSPYEYKIYSNPYTVEDQISQIIENMNNSIDLLIHHRLVSFKFIICLNAKQIQN